jgi:phosphoadenosine phosphosulfate reductase
MSVISVIDFPASELEALGARHANSSAEELLEAMLTDHFAGRIALLSSFGAESAALLHMVSRIDRATPIVFLDTGKLFPETLRYRDRLVEQLGLTNLIEAHPDAARLAQLDPDGLLWQTDPDMCCWQRKVEPTDEALAPYAAWITGRKHFHGGLRGALPMIEQDDGGKIKINPLVGWSRTQIDYYFAENALPQHPLVMRNYRSIGCAPCTRATAPNEAARAGRWSGTAKTECGIHLPRREAV